MPTIQSRILHQRGCVGWLVVLLLVTAVVTALWGCADQTPAAGLSVTDSAGVRLVEIGDPTTLQLPERFATVTAEIGTGEAPLYQVSVARLLESGRLAVGNGGTAEVLYFDPDGALVRRVGGQGDGPGEFRAITTFPATAGDTLTVHDVRQGRLTVLDERGRVAGTRPLRPPSRVVDLLPLTIGDDGRVVAVHGEARIFATGGVIRDTVPLMVIDPPSTVDTVSLWPGKQWSFGSSGRGAFRTEVGFGYALAASGRDGRAVVGSTDRLRLAVVNDRGETFMRIASSQRPRPVAPEEVERWRQERLGSMPANVPAGIRTAVEEAPHNETHPAFSDLLMDADRRIWIGETAAPEDRRRWTVLEPGGERGFQVVLPASATPLDARDHRLVLLDRTDLDEEVIRLVRLDDEGRIR